MQTILPLAALGRRIMILGPSNAGKSTLAVALGRKLDTPHIHLDLLYHQPETDWIPRPAGEFDALHDTAIAGEKWVIEGNYMRLLPMRAARATGIILLGTGRWSALRRYIVRTLFDSSRLGIHEGVKDRLNGRMMHFIMLEQPRKRARDIDLLTATGLPMVTLSSMAETKGLYAAWGLERG